MATNNLHRSLHIGTYAGIPVKIHWTFGFLILFVIYTAYDNEFSLKASIGFGAYILILFLCVTLHEYGHALMARRYGVPTDDILLTPIGGIASMGAINIVPKHEFFIALAGPLVNVVIAIVLSIVIYFGMDGIFLPVSNEVFDNLSDLLRMVLIMNVLLFSFNLIPAYPMDGGRVLRSLIAMKTGYDRATIIATFIGMLLSLGFIGLAIYLPHPTMGFIGIFIFIMAYKERRYTKKVMSLNAPISNYCYKEFRIVNHRDKFEKYFDIINDTTLMEKSFLVVDDLQEVIGTLPFLYIVEAYKSQPKYEYVYELMRNSVGYLDGSTSISETANYMNNNDYHVIGITNNGKLIGTANRSLIQKLYK